MINYDYVAEYYKSLCLNLRKISLIDLLVTSFKFHLLLYGEGNLQYYYCELNYFISKNSLTSG